MLTRFGIYQNAAFNDRDLPPNLDISGAQFRNSSFRVSGGIVLAGCLLLDSCIDVLRQKRVIDPDTISLAQSHVTSCQITGDGEKRLVLDNVIMLKTTLTGMSLRSASLAGSLLQSCAFTDCQISHMSRGVQRHAPRMLEGFFNCTFTRCRFSYCDFTLLNWAGCTFVDCSFNNVRITPFTLDENRVDPFTGSFLVGSAAAKRAFIPFPPGNLPKVVPLSSLASPPPPATNKYKLSQVGDTTLIKNVETDQVSCIYQKVYLGLVRAFGKNHPCIPAFSLAIEKIRDGDPLKDK